MRTSVTKNQLQIEMESLTKTDRRAETEYLVEMKLVPVSVIPTPQEGLAFSERFVRPTLQGLQRLREAGRIVAGGPTAGGTAFAFILRAGSPDELDAALGALPLWPRCETKITPLVSFEQRLARAEERLLALRAKIAEKEGAPPT